MTPWIFYRKTFLAVAFFVPLQVLAYTVAPNILTLESTGSGSSSFLQLKNKGVTPVAVEFTIHKHRKDIDGKAIKGAEAADDFIIYPPQLVMIPGDELAVQVLWIGDAELDTERTYTIVTHQVQIPQKVANLPESSAGISLDIKVLINYEGRIYVTPLGAKPNVVVESVTQHTPTKSVGEDQGSPEPLFLEVILANQGMAHQPMAKMSLVFVPLDLAGSPLKQLAITLPSTNIPGMKPHLLAGERRRLFIVRPKGLPPGPVDVILSNSI